MLFILHELVITFICNILNSLYKSEFSNFSQLCSTVLYFLSAKFQQCFLFIAFQSNFVYLMLISFKRQEHDIANVQIGAMQESLRICTGLTCTASVCFDNKLVLLLVAIVCWSLVCKKFCLCETFGAENAQEIVLMAVS